MTRADLAKLTDTTPKQIRRYEVGDVVPRTLEILVDIALTLGVSIEEMLSPAWVEARRARILAQLNTQHRVSRAGPGDAPRYLSIAVYAGYMLVTLLTPQTLTMLGKYRVQKDNIKNISIQLQSLATSVLAYEPIDAVVIEPTNTVLKHMRHLGVRIHEVTLDEARRELLTSTPRPTNAALYRFVAATHPAIRTSAEQQSAPSVLATTNRWQMVTLHPVALGLTVMKREYPETFQSLCHI